MALDEGQIERIKMTDVGTRMNHLSDLRDVWQTALDALTRQTGYSPSMSNKELKNKLEGALELLMSHMQKDYMSTNWKYRNAINNLKDPSDA